jgi:uncharacterized protein (DUF433 family)
MKPALERVEINPEIMAGKPVIRGTRIPVATILGLLAEGAPIDEILTNYPDLTRDDIAAALAFAAEVTSFEELRAEAPPAR